MEKKKKIDDLFKSELGSYTETPPPAVWEALEERLDGAGKPRSPRTWLSYLAILCLFITATIWVATGLTGSKKKLAQGPTAEQSATTTGIPTGNNGPNTEHTGNVPAENNTTVSNNNTDNENNTNTASSPTTTTGPNRVSNAQPAVYTSTGAPMPVAASGNKISQNNSEPASRNTGRPNTRKATGNQTNRPANGHTGKKNNNNSSGKSTNKTSSTHGTYATANEANKSDYEDNNNSGPRQGNNGAGTTTARQGENTAQINNEKDEQTAKQDNVTTPQQDNKQDPQKFVPNDAPKPKKPKAKFDRFEAGVKAGYEQGFIADAAQKGVFAAFTQYRVSKKVAVMLQPAVKYGNVTSRQIGDVSSYYRANDGGITNVRIDTIPGSGTDSVIIPPSYWYHYNYSRSHDSIVKSNWTGGKYLELEMPILVKFYPVDKLSIYGGVNVVYSKLTGLTEQTYTEKGITRSTSLEAIYPNPVTVAQLSHPDYQYSGTNYNQYTGPQYPAPTASTFRIGYMAGFSWEFEDRWLIDALVQQTFIKPNIQGGFNTYTPLTTPYFRLSLGYKIIK